MKRIYMSILTALLFCGIAEARTWWVQKDGTGDFTVIQDAVDAAAAGDTIRIGPGRFYEGQTVEFPNGSSIFTRVYIYHREITIIGSGAEHTFIGQAESWDVPQGDHKGIYAHSYQGVERVEVRNLCIENAREGIYSWGVEMDIEHCRFEACDIAIMTLTHASSGLYVSDSQFVELARDMMFIYTNWLALTRIENCVFTLGESTWGRWHIGLNNVADAVIEGCEFLGGEMGVQLDQRTVAHIRRCIFDGQTFFGLHTVQASTESYVEHCTFRNQRRAHLLSDPTVTHRATHCTFENISEASYEIRGALSIQVNNCDLGRGAQYTVMATYKWSAYQDPTSFDFTNNYWGTSDPDSIAAWIRDANDTDETEYTILFEPFRTDSTPTQRRSLSGVRRLFR
ncbi:MAG: right-handed parallel beta-helix repeat-containing protein [Candidatus Krumholzibacteriia bacterium]